MEMQKKTHSQSCACQNFAWFLFDRYDTTKNEKKKLAIVSKRSQKLPSIDNSRHCLLSLIIIYRRSNLYGVCYVYEICVFWFYFYFFHTFQFGGEIKRIRNVQTLCIQTMSMLLVQCQRNTNRTFWSSTPRMLYLFIRNDLRQLHGTYSTRYALRHRHSLRPCN